MWNLAAKGIGGLFKLGKWGIIAGGTVLGGSALVGSTQTGRDFIKGVAERPLEGGAELAAGAGAQQTKSGFFEMVGFFAEILKALGVKGGIPETIMNFANRGHALGGGNPIHNEARWAADDARYGGQGLGNNGPTAGVPGGSNPGGSNNDGGGSGLGTAALATAGIATVGTAGFYGTRAVKNMMGGAPGLATAGVADDAYTAMQGQIGAADDVARTAGRFGRWGKIAAIGATVVGGGAALLSGSPAEASTLTSAATAAGGGLTANANNNGGSINTMGADVAGLGLSILGGKAAATATASVAAPALASLGVKAIPGIASIYAAGEGIYNTASYALKGEWTKAGLSLVSGVGETVAGLGGAATYLTVGTAWREAVRAGGAMAFGEENTIEHSAVVNVGSWLKDQFFGATSGTANAPAPQALAPRTNGPALAF